MELLCDVLCSVESLVALEPEWWTLWESDPRATPFQSPAWLLPWVRNLWGGGKIRSIAMRAGGRLVGLAPLFIWGPRGAATLSFLGSGITDYLDMLAAPGFENACAGAFLEQIDAMSGEWLTCDLQELRTGSPLLRSRPGAYGFAHASRDECGVCLVTELPVSIEEFMGARDAKFRTDLRRAESRLRSNGALEIQSGQHLLDALFRLHAARWKERSEDGMLSTDALQRFHGEVARLLSERCLLRLSGLFLNGRCIAVQYNMRAKGTVYAYLSGFDPEWSKYSPGAVLLKHSIAESIREGATAFDFLRNREPFKYLWGATEAPNHKLVLTQ